MNVSASSFPLPTPRSRWGSILDKLLSGQGLWPAVPAIVVLIVVAVIPFFLLLSLGFADFRVAQGRIVERSFSLGFVTSALADPLYHVTFQRSLTLALSTMTLCVVLGYPVAYLYLTGGPRIRKLILFLTIVPLLTSGIVRTYAWMVILGARGIVNTALLSLGVIDRPLRIMNTHWAVLIGMVQIHLPVMILPLIAVMSRYDRYLDEASENLGASKLATLWHVILPLSVPAIGAGAGLVFVLSYTTFVVPQLLGGGNYLNAATMIYEQVVYSLEWNRAAVSALLLMLSCLVVLSTIAILTNLFCRWTREAQR
ncbi:ABC transporter permease [Aureimonas populi]|uniref:ABC transporter permease n=1 Tax=Aureimonas populi TaxID=1701758 RepID=A0ABW5CQG4_9HYPH|nr:ABC transporter permease [Aureimonas populi]